MRRVIDDSYYAEAERKIMEIVRNIPADKVSKYDWGTYRAKVHLVRAWVEERVSNIKFGKCEHANGIGNNNALEIIYTGNSNEEQICGLFHLTDNMFGSVICWVSDYDETRKTGSRKIHGCDPKSEYDMKYFRFT